MPGMILRKLAEFGQSIWLDNISRSVIKNGSLQKLITLGLRGLTSNPTIFEKAVNSSPEYDEEILRLSQEGKSAFDIYDEITARDIQSAADLFLPVFKETKSFDGYVSLEVNPEFCDDTLKTIEEARRLQKKVSRANLMLKIPATEAGFRAVEELTAEGFNINVTLIFSLRQYQLCAESYLRGIKRFIEKGKDPRSVHSVASVFVSRIDTMIDKFLEEKKSSSLSLKGKAAVANCSFIYKEFMDNLSSQEFNSLQSKGVNMQRVLWGSTSTKNPEYSDIKYITQLIAKNTVNTLPENTILAFLDHGTVRPGLGQDKISDSGVLEDLEKEGINIDSVCRKLLIDGLSAFKKSFKVLLDSIDQKSRAFCNK